MLHVVLLILKIIGILLVSLIGLILVLGLLILFVPIRYRLAVDRKVEALSVNIRAAWLLRFVCLRVTYIDSDLKIRLKIAGILFYDNKKPKKERIKESEDSQESHRKSRRKKKNKKRNRTKNKSKEIKSNENAVITFKEDKIEEVEKGSLVKDDTSKELNNNEINNNEINNNEIKSNNVKDIRINANQVQDDETSDDEPKVNETIDDEIKVREVNEKGINEKAINEKGINDKGINEYTNIESNNIIYRFFSKIKHVILKIISFFQKTYQFLKSFKQRAASFTKTLKQLTDNKNLIKNFIVLEENKSGILKVLASVWGIVRHIAPRNVKGILHFGTGDPCSTGQALAAAAVLFGFYGRYISIDPDFEEEVFEVELYIKGRIRVVRLLMIAIKLIREKHFSIVMKNIKQLKEDLYGRAKL